MSIVVVGCFVPDLTLVRLGADYPGGEISDEGAERGVT